MCDSLGPPESVSQTGRSPLLGGAWISARVRGFLWVINGHTRGRCTQACSLGGSNNAAYGFWLMCGCRCLTCRQMLSWSQFFLKHFRTHSRGQLAAIDLPARISSTGGTVRTPYCATASFLSSRLTYRPKVERSTRAFSVRRVAPPQNVATPRSNRSISFVKL